MPACADLRVLFRAAAGPRRGFGHLVRCRSLARALGVRPAVSVRGPRQAAQVAQRLGCEVVSAPARRLLAARRPHVLIVDDPVPGEAARWIRAAREAGIAVASVHDLGLGCHDADLLIDGSITTTLPAAGPRTAIGPAFAVVDPGLAVRTHPPHERRGILISLGGGPRAATACAIAAEIARRAPDVQVRVVGGFVSRRPPVPPPPKNVVWVGASSNLAGELRRAEVAVVGGGVSLYEACALGTPAVAVAVVEGQRPTVSSFVSRGAALGGAALPVRPGTVAEDALRLLRSGALRRTVAGAARRLVDGRGASRAARAILQLVEGA